MKYRVIDKESFIYGEIVTQIGVFTPLYGFRMFGLFLDKYGREIILQDTCVKKINNKCCVL